MIFALEGRENTEKDFSGISISFPAWAKEF